MNTLNTFFLLVFTTTIPNILHAKTWEEILTEKASILSDDVYQIIKEQHAAYEAKTVTTIAAEAIKCIAIVECGESLINVEEMHHPRISMLPNPPLGKPFAGPQYNSGLPNAPKMRLGLWEKLKQIPYFLDELAEHFGYKPKTIHIRVFEGLRDLSTQARLFQKMIEEVTAKNPTWSESAIEAEAKKWVSPVKNNTPVHSTGAAVDIRLWNSESENFVDLGEFGVIWGAKESGPTFFEGLTDTQKMNRLFLLMAASKAGLHNYPYEYWHFSTGDRADAFWSEKDPAKRIARYGPVS